MEILDSNGTARDWAWLTGKYGRLEHRQGESYPRYALVRVQETLGPANLKLRVLDENGRPAGVLAILTYPSLAAPADDLPDITHGDPPKSQWATRGAAQFTDGLTGLTGFGLGANSWIKDLAAGGPYHAWLFHTAYASDCLSWIGWLGGTDHMGPCDLTFQLKLAGEDGGEEPEPEPGTPELLAPLGRIAAAGERMAAAEERVAGAFERLLAHIGA